MADEVQVKDSVNDLSTMRSMVTLILPLASAVHALRRASGPEARERASTAVSAARCEFTENMAVLAIAPDLPALRTQLISSAMELALLVVSTAETTGEPPADTWQRHLLAISH